MKKIILILAITSLFSCTKDAKESTQDGSFIIEFLFEKDGCKMYRFNDGMHIIYWSNCEGSTMQNYNEQQGKLIKNVTRQTITTK